MCSQRNFDSSWGSSCRWDYQQMGLGFATITLPIFLNVCLSASGPLLLFLCNGGGALIKGVSNE